MRYPLPSLLPPKTKTRIYKDGEQKKIETEMLDVWLEVMTAKDYKSNF